MAYQMGSGPQSESQGFLEGEKTATSYATAYEPDPPLPPRPARISKRRAWAGRAFFVLSLVIGLGWIGPILYLMVVNIEGTIIGAAAWCPFNRQCDVLSYYPSEVGTAAYLSAQYDHDNHNLIGALQFVAKALEVWFVYIATSLVWCLTILLARRPNGLPLGYFLTHMEFQDLRVLLDPILYRTAGSTVGGRSITNKATIRNIRIFLATAVVLCVIANLMGPSVAVLVIPTLFWNNGTITPLNQFQSLASGSPPTVDAIPGCTAQQLELGQTSCAANFYGMALDALASSWVNELFQVEANPSPDLSSDRYFTLGTAVAVEQAIPFTFNQTASQNQNKSTGTMWAPSRQALRGLSSDFEDLFLVVLGNTTNQTILNQYEPYNSSLQLVLQRYAPIIGMRIYEGAGAVAVTTVGDDSDDKQIRCYHNWTDNNLPKCLRTGLGWNVSTAIDSFTLEKNGSGETVTAVAYWSDKAVYLSTDSDPCFPNGTLPADNSCDFDAIFGNASTSSLIMPDDQVNDTLVLEWSLPHANNPADVFVYEAFPGFNFAAYSIDVTQIWPTLPPMVVADPPAEDSLWPIVIHPSWVLAAWNVDSGQNVTSSSDAAVLMRQNLPMFVPQINSANTTIEEELTFSIAICAGISRYAISHGASLISYETSPVPSNSNNLPAKNPVLWSNVYNQVWGWSTDSRTAKVGLTVCGLGIAIVLIRTALLVITKAKEPSSLELITTAIRHSHQGELGEADEEAAARLRYRMLEDEREEKMHLLHVTHL